MDLNAGGPTQSIKNLLNNFSNLSEFKKIHLLSLVNKNSLLPDDLNIKIDFFKYESLNRLYSNLKLSEFDLVHIHGLWEFGNHFLSNHSRKSNIPYIISPRGALEPWSLEQKKLKKKIAFIFYQKKDLEKATFIHATSNQEANSFRKLGLKNKIIVIPNGIDLEGVNISDRTEKDNIILFISRLHPKKGIEVLLDAILLLKDKLKSKWRVEIYGSGEPGYVNILKKSIEIKGLGNFVKIQEPIYGEYKIRKIRSSKFLVLPSYSENFGNIIAESLACQTPVITTTNTPWEELVEFNCGWHIELGVNQLKIAIENAIGKSDSELLTMGLNGRKLIESKYDYRIIANTFRDLYMHILHNSAMSNLNIFQ